MTAPMAFQWDGEAMTPLHPRLADKAFVVGERYVLTEHQERSHATHAHYFAALNEVWQNLPEEQAERFPTVEHLRKWCLIKAGYSDLNSVVCSSAAEAQRVAAFVKPLDAYAVVIVRGAAVQVYTAQSQSMRAMGKDVFQKSKQAVLDIAAAMIGVTADTLHREAGKAA